MKSARAECITMSTFQGQLWDSILLLAAIALGSCKPKGLLWLRDLSVILALELQSLNVTNVSKTVQLYMQAQVVNRARAALYLPRGHVKC